MPAKPLLLYFDEDVSARVSDNLRNRGFDVRTTVEARMLGASDQEQLAYAAEHRRILITHNIKDFVALHTDYLAAHKPHSGIFLAIRRKEPSAITNRLLLMLRDATAESMQSQVLYF